MSSVPIRIVSLGKAVPKTVITNDDLTKILEKHPEKIFLKIDCEGAEHEIIPSLY